MSEQASSDSTTTSMGQQDVALRIPPLEGRARLRKWLMAGAALLVIGGAVVYFSWPEPTPERFRTLPVSRQTIVHIVEAVGRVDVRSRVEVPAPIQGQLTALHVTEGDTVKRGELLAELDERASALALQGARAAASAAQGRTSQARASLDAAEQALTRARALFAQKLASPVDVSTAESELAQARAVMEAAQGERSVAQHNIAAAQLTTSLGRIEAPADGVILRAPQRVGSAVSADAGPLFVIGEALTTMRVDASVSETDVRFVKPGQTAEVVVAAAAGRSFTGHVQRVAVDADRVDGAVLYPVTLLVDNPERLLLPGMTARVRMEVARADQALAVHEAALRFTPPDAQPAELRSRVWRRVSGSQLDPVGVKVGISDGVYSEVTPLAGSALSVGDQLVVGLAQIEPGADVPRITLGKGK